MRKPARRARRALLGGGAVFLAGQLLLSAAVEYARPAWRDPEYGSRLQRLRERLADRPERRLVLALGSSRTEMGLRPDAVAAELPDPDAWQVFNFGLAGHGPLRQLLVLHRLRSAGVRPAAVLVEVFPPALMHDEPGEAVFEGGRLTRADLTALAPYVGPSNRLAGEWTAARLSPWSASRFCLLGRYAPGWLPSASRVDYLWTGLDPNGWLPYPRAVLTAAERERGFRHTAEQYAPSLRNFHIAGPPDRALRDLLTRCRADRIPAALYLMPESASFRAWYPPAAEAQLDDYLRTLSREWGTPVIDGRAWNAEAEFADGHHLLPGGATAFSRRLGAALRPWLSGARTP